MTTYVTALRHDLNVVSRLKRSVRSNPLTWYAAAALLGLLLSTISLRRRKVVVKGRGSHSERPKQAGGAALALTALKFALDLAKPSLMRWVYDRLGARASAAHARRS